MLYKKKKSEHLVYVGWHKAIAISTDSIYKFSFMSI